MIWLKGVLGARWFPYVLIGAATIATGVFGWGYMKGYSRAESTYQQEMNKALERQLKRVMSQKGREIALALKGAEEKNEVVYRVREVVRPSTSCELPPKCVQWYDDILRATTSD